MTKRMYDTLYVLALLGPAVSFGIYDGWGTGVLTGLLGFILAVAANRAYVVFEERRGEPITSIAGLTLFTLPASEIIVGTVIVAYF